MAIIITKVLVRIGDHDVLFAVNKDCVLVPNENGLKVIRDHYGYENDSPIDCYMYLYGLVKHVDIVVDGFRVDTIVDWTIIDTKKEGV